MNKRSFRLKNWTAICCLKRTPIGRAKAKFFRATGYDETNLNVLEINLLAIAHNADVVETISTVRGTKYVVDGTVETPTSRQVSLRTVWIIETNEARPRFRTACPV